MARIDTLTNYLTDIATAIKTKKGDNTPILASNFDTEIANLPSGGGGGAEPEEKDVNFYDYDGTRLYSYTTGDFLNLSSMPENPTHSGLTSQGWNWTLSNAKTYVSNYGELDIGQLYITDDGKTRIYIELDEYSLNPTLGFSSNGSVTIDWGDGNTSTKSGSSLTTILTIAHTYSEPGNYMITLYSSSSIRISGTGYGSKLLTLNNSSDNYVNDIYLSKVKKIEIGARTSLNTMALNTLYNLETISIPSGMTTNGNYTFGACYSLKGLVLPSSITAINQQDFSNCVNLKHICLPNITYIGQSGFSSCSTLKRICVSNVTNGGNSAFNGCTNLKEINLPHYTSSTTSMFSGCTILEKVKIDSMSTIPNSLFSNCRCLTIVNIPNVTSVGNLVFSNCFSLRYIYFIENTSVPTLSNTNTFSSIANTNYKIVVPDDLYTEWRSATNWSNSNIVNHIIRESDV